MRVNLLRFGDDCLGVTCKVGTKPCTLRVSEFFGLARWMRREMNVYGAIPCQDCALDQLFNQDVIWSRMSSFEDEPQPGQGWLIFVAVTRTPPGLFIMGMYPSLPS